MVDTFSPFPAKRITNSIYEVEVSLVVFPHQVASAKPRVARVEYVAQDLSFGGLLVSIALEPARRDLIRSR